MDYMVLINAVTEIICIKKMIHKSKCELIKCTKSLCKALSLHCYIRTFRLI